MIAFRYLFTVVSFSFSAFATPSGLHPNHINGRGHHEVAKHASQIVEREVEQRTVKRRRASCNLTPPTSSPTTVVASAASESVGGTTSTSASESIAVPSSDFGSVASATSSFTVVDSAPPTSSAVVVSSSSSTKVPTSSTESSPPPSSTAAAPPQASSSGSHLVTFTNKCSSSIQPAVANTACGYSPRCSGAGSYTAAQPASLAPGSTSEIYLPYAFVGRIYAEISACGAAGADCTMLEFNLDTGNFYTPQAYDISNIQGFTQSIQLSAAGCDTVTCTSASCSCEDAYPIGDESGCGADLPVKACGAGPIAFDVVFCP